MATTATITNFLNGWILDVPHANFEPGQRIQIYPANHPISINQKWTIVGNADHVPIPVGYLNFFAGDGPSAAPLCLDIPHASTTPGTLLQIYPPNQPGGTKNQQWTYIPGPNNKTYIASALNNNLVLEAQDGDGPLLIQTAERVEGKASQLWLLNAVE